MPSKSVQDDIRVGTKINLKEQEKIDRELQALAEHDPRGLILRLAELGRTDEARERLQNLEEAYRLKVGELQKILDDSQKPPLRDAVFLKPSPDGPQQSAIVGIGGSRMEVAIAVAPPVPAADLPGREVWVNGDNQIVKFRDEYVRGEAD